VTLAVDDLVFINTQLSVGETIIVKAQVNCAWGTSMECGCTVVADDENGSTRRLCKAFFTFVSQDSSGKKIRLPKLQAEDGDNLRRLSLAAERRKIRFRRAAIIARAAATFSLKLRATSEVSSSDETKRSHTTTTTASVAALEHETSSSVSSTSVVLAEENCISAPPLVMTEIVLPQHANHHGNTFGGQIMAWMSIAARVVASRHANASSPSSSLPKTPDKKMVVLAQSIDDIFFVSPSRVGDRVVVEARVTRTFARTLEVSCEVHAHKVGGEKRLINQAFWILEVGAFGEKVERVGKEVQQEEEEIAPLLQVDPEYSDEARVAFEQALGRRALRIQRNALGSGHNLDPSWNWEDPSGMIMIEKMEKMEKQQNGYHVELTARNVTSLLEALCVSGTGKWGLLEAASTPQTKLYMRQDNDLIVGKAVSRLSCGPTSTTTTTTNVTNTTNLTSIAKSSGRRASLFGVFRKKEKSGVSPASSATSSTATVDDSQTFLGRLFAVLCDNSRRPEWDVLCETSETVLSLDDTNDVTRLVLKRQGSLSDFSLLRSWRANEDRSQYVIANHSIKSDSLTPEVDGVKRGAVGSSGWVMELVEEVDGSEVCELTYIVTLAAAGIQALGTTALDVMAGQSKVICMNIAGIAKVVEADLL